MQFHRDPLFPGHLSSHVDVGPIDSDGIFTTATASKTPQDFMAAFDDVVATMRKIRANGPYLTRLWCNKAGKQWLIDNLPMSPDNLMQQMQGHVDMFSGVPLCIDPMLPAEGQIVDLEFDDGTRRRLGRDEMPNRGERSEPLIRFRDLEEWNVFRPLRAPRTTVRIESI